MEEGVDMWKTIWRDQGGLRVESPVDNSPEVKGPY